MDQAWWSVEGLCLLSHDRLPHTSESVTPETPPSDCLMVTTGRAGIVVAEQKSHMGVLLNDQDSGHNCDCKSRTICIMEGWDCFQNSNSVLLRVLFSHFVSRWLRLAGDN